jgi:quinol monooxygenase YgiN
MAEITLIARFVAKVGKAEELKAVLANAIATTQAEPGCKVYDLYESPETGRFFFWELWESQEALDVHAKAPHIQILRAQAADLIAEPVELSSLKAVNK